MQTGETWVCNRASVESFKLKPTQLVLIYNLFKFQVLQCENARLKKSLQEAETKVQMKLNDLPSPLKSLGRSSDLAASKIVELSKKVRELSAKLGAAENKANNAEAQLAVYMGEQPIENYFWRKTIIGGFLPSSGQNLQLAELMQ